MVLLMEYAPGARVAQKRKGAEDPAGQFACPGDGDLVSCRATKMRRLESAGSGHDAPAAVVMASDVSMEEEPPSPSLGAAEGERALVVYSGPDVDAAPAGGQYRLRPWAPVSAGAEWIRDMLREADSRTVRAVLSRAQGEGGADLAVVPWVAAPAPAETDQASTAAETVDREEEDAEGAAAMDVEQDMWQHQTSTLGASGCGDGYLWRWPQHCLAPPPPLPAVGQASPAVWSW